MTRLVGGMCALREYNGRVETLLIQNPYWNLARERPKRLPGEWVFPSSEVRPGENTCEAATRAFKEKVDTNAVLYNQRKFTEVLYDKKADDMRIDFYQANTELSLNAVGNRGKWMSAQEWIRLICSPEFTQQQHQAFIREGLSQTNPPVDVRTRPTATLEALLRLAVHKKISANPHA